MYYTWTGRLSRQEASPARQPLAAGGLTDRSLHCLVRSQPTSGWALHEAKGWLVAGRVMSITWPGAKVYRGCRTQFGPVREMDLDPDLAQCGPGGVLDRANERIGVRFVRQDQPSAGADLVKSLVQHELGTGLFTAFTGLRAFVVLAGLGAAAVLTRLGAAAKAASEGERRGDANQHKNRRDMPQGIRPLIVRPEGTGTSSEMRRRCGETACRLAEDPDRRLDRRSSPGRRRSPAQS